MQAASEGPDYAKLRRLVKGAGLFDTQPRYYVTLVLVNSALFAVCLAIFLVTRNIWVAVPNAVALALISGQLGFQLHDSAHNQMFASRRVNTLIAFIIVTIRRAVRFLGTVSSA